MKIGLDVMGGDFAPEKSIYGVVITLQKNVLLPENICLIGDKAQILPLLKKYKIEDLPFTIQHASQNIDMCDIPTSIVKDKQDSSIAIGYKMLANEEIDGFISAGNSGAILAGAQVILKPIEGLARLCIGTLLPRSNGKHGFLLDVGANSDCKPEYLDQFAILGSIYMKLVYGRPDPTVGLLNIGEEESKGNALAQATFQLLKVNKYINFVGNMEGRDLLKIEGHTSDVVVCEGFSGNVILKLIESIYNISKMLQIEHPYFKQFDFESYGGTPILGLSKPVLLGHGISEEEAFKSMFIATKSMIENKVCEEIKQVFQKIK
ncbi:MAG: phosphate acyltransferase PlsX [Chitinophagaceae bacterium]